MTMAAIKLKALGSLVSSEKELELINDSYRANEFHNSVEDAMLDLRFNKTLTKIGALKQLIRELDTKI